jgi:hypothetical protein
MLQFPCSVSFWCLCPSQMSKNARLIFGFGNVTLQSWVISTRTGYFRARNGLNGRNDALGFSSDSGSAARHLRRAIPVPSPLGLSKRFRSRMQIFRSTFSKIASRSEKFALHAAPSAASVDSAPFRSIMIESQIVRNPYEMTRSQIWSGSPASARNRFFASRAACCRSAFSRASFSAF